LLIRVASDDGRLYGSVSPRDVSNAINEFLSKNSSVKDASVDRDSVNLGIGVKALGVYEVSVSLYGNVDVKIKLNVCRSESDAESNMKKYETDKKLHSHEQSAAKELKPEVTEAKAEESSQNADAS
jgi:large subunit ribosomal protein L9